VIDNNSFVAFACRMTFYKQTYSVIFFKTCTFPSAKNAHKYGRPSMNDKAEYCSNLRVLELCGSQNAWALLWERT